MAALPGGILNNPRWQALDANGDILPSAKLYAYITGGTYSSPQSLYSDADLSVALTNPVVADSSGRFAAMYLQAVGYDLRLKDANDVTIWSCLDVEDVGQTFLSTLGTQQASGSFDVASGYVVLDGDWMVTTDASDTTSPFILNLPVLATWTEPITIKHQSALALRVTPNGTDKIEGIAAYYAVAAAATPNFPTLTVVPGSASWYIQSSHGL